MTTRRDLDAERRRQQAEDAAEAERQLLVEGHLTDEAQETSWAPVDLTPALTGLDVPPPDLGRRTDGPALIYRGRTHWFIGDSETCKSWCALHIAHQVLEGGGRVLWVDFEDDARGVVARLRSLGADAETIHDRFVYVQPEEPLVDSRGRATGGNVALGEMLGRDPFDLAVIDGVTEAMVTEGLDLRDNADVAVWTRRLPKRIAAAGPGVICIDHLPKGRDANTRDAIGGQHKRAGTTGAVLRFDLVRPFARPAGTDPSEGLVNVVVTKDRPGHVRARADGDRVAVLDLTGYPDGSVSITLDSPTTEPTPDLGLCRRILEFLETYDGASKNVIEREVEGNATNIRRAVTWMVAQGWVRTERKGNAHLHSITDAGRGQR